MTTERIVENPLITIDDHWTKTASEWEAELDPSFSPVWFDSIIISLEENGLAVEHLVEKRKACYIHCAETKLENYRIWVEKYQQVFGEPYPVFGAGVGI